VTDRKPPESRLESASTESNDDRMKRLIGEEVRAFANARGIKEPVKEKDRCWRLDYADTVRFHMDVLPAIPDDEAFHKQLAQLGVGEQLAEHALAITDRTHSNYLTISDDWPRSNPKGYALWFEGRMQVIARQRRVALVEQRVYASVDDVPVYELKTPLQRAVQILKRHRDGRRNVYEIDHTRSLRHAVEADCTVGELLTMVGQAASTA